MSRRRTDRTRRAETADDTISAGSRAAASAGTSRRNSALIASGILVSRISGLVRERALGHFFGTSYVADAFTAAFRIPNMLQHLMGEGVLSASFIPVYSRLLSEGRDEEAGKVAGAVVGLLAVLTGVLTVIGVVLAEPLTLVVAAGLRSRPETFDLTVTLVRILFPCVGFLVLSAWCLGVLNSHRRFFLSYVAPVMLNIAQIGVLVGVGLTVYGADLGRASPEATTQESLVLWLAAGTVVGGALQFFVQLPGVLRVTRGLRPSLRTDLPGVRDTARAFGPVVASRGVVQLSSYVQVLLASFLAVGALATLRYGQILYLLPISLFGMSVAAAELPELSRADREERQAAVRRLDDGLGRIAAFVVPTAIGYLVVGDVITGALFRTGAFDRLDARAVWIVLAGYSLGLLATTSSRLLQSALYGIGNARTPARVAVLRVAVSVACGVVLMFQFDRLGVTSEGVRQLGDLPAFGPLPDDRRSVDSGDLIRLGAAGLSTATAIAAWIEYAFLRRAVRREIGSTALGGGQLPSILAAGTVAAVAGVATRPVAQVLPPIPAGALAIATTGTVYLGVAAVLGVPEIRRLLQTLRYRLARRG